MEARTPARKSGKEEKETGKEGLDRNHRLFVSNVPFNIADLDILGFFPGAASIERHAKNGVLTGAVFVQCRSAEDVKRLILDCNGKEMHGRVIKVTHLKDREAYITAKKNEENEEKDENRRGRRIREQYENEKSKDEKESYEKERTVFITNLALNDSEKEVREKFAVFGEIEQCTVMKNKETGVSIGKAFVLFTDPAATKKALRDQIILSNRILTVMKYVSPEALKKREEEKYLKEKDRKKRERERAQGKGEKRDPKRVSTCRVHISHMDKKHSRKSISKVIEDYFQEKQEKKVKLRGINITVDSSKRNPGYGFVTFKFPEDAQVFLENQRELKGALGKNMTAEYAMESKEFQTMGIKKKPSKEDRIAKREGKKQ